MIIEDSYIIMASFSAMWGGLILAADKIGPLDVKPTTMPCMMGAILLLALLCRTLWYNGKQFTSDISLQMPIATMP